MVKLTEILQPKKSAARIYADGFTAGFQSVDGNEGVKTSVPAMPPLKAGETPYELGFGHGKAKAELRSE